MYSIFFRKFVEDPTNSEQDFHRRSPLCAQTTYFYGWSHRERIHSLRLSGVLPFIKCHKSRMVIRMSLDQSFLMKEALQTVVSFLMGKGLHPVLYGSSALACYVRDFPLAPQDIDLAFRSREEHDEAVASLQRERAFTLMKQFEWTSDRGSISVNSVLRSKEGVLFDISFSLGDLLVDLEHPSIVNFEGCSVPVLSLEDLKRSYQRFGHEKPGSEERLRLIENLMQCNDGDK